MPEKRDIKNSMVCRAVLSYYSSPVNRKHNVQVLQTDVMNYLVISPLQECGINGNNGFYTLRSQTGGKGYGMLLRYSDIIKPFRIFFCEVLPTLCLPSWRR